MDHGSIGTRGWHPQTLLEILSGIFFSGPFQGVKYSISLKLVWLVYIVTLTVKPESIKTSDSKKNENLRL